MRGPNRKRLQKNPLQGRNRLWSGQLLQSEDPPQGRAKLDHSSLSSRDRLQYAWLVGTPAKEGLKTDQMRDRLNGRDKVRIGWIRRRLRHPHLGPCFQKCLQPILEPALSLYLRGNLASGIYGIAWPNCIS